MSIENAREFLLRVESDPDILNDILDKIDISRTFDEKVDIIVSFAQSIGYYFSALDIKVVSSEIGDVCNDNSYEIYGGKSILKKKTKFF
jgi:hypothetical protein